MTTENENNKLSKVGAFKVKAIGLAARKQALANKAREAGHEIPDIDPLKAEHRVGILFDDSASMSGSKIDDAHAGTEEFLRSCNPRNTSVAVYPMNPSLEEGGHRKIPLSNKMYTTAVAIKSYHAIGGTPMFEMMLEMLQNENLTRAIVFSDGAPNYGDEYLMPKAIQQAKEKQIPVDTVFIGHKSDTKAINIMQSIAEQTGGIFMIFEPGKANFRTAFKYLSPGYRAMLMDKSFVEKLQEGKVDG
jgi:hypothetical protein